MNSPYNNLPPDKWLTTTSKLIKAHPLSVKELTEVTLQSWNEIFNSKIGSKPFSIGKDILPIPQIMGFLLHELVPLEFEKRYPSRWRKDKTANEKDLIYVPNDKFSIEIKTSSSKNHIYGNRSYAQEAHTDRKSKSGYYLTVNFEKFEKESNKTPRVILIRFGWLDHSDWKGQSAATGQQSVISPDVYRYKLPIIYSAK